MTRKKLGRPPTGNQVREVELGFSLTKQDADKLTAMAAGLGFKSRPEMITAILERLILGGWAPAAWAKLGWQIRSRAMKTGYFVDDAGWFNPFEKWPPLPVEDPPRPTLALPEEELAAREKTTLLRELKDSL